MNSVLPTFPFQFFTPKKAPGDISVSSKIQRVVDYLLFKRTDLEGVVDIQLAKQVLVECTPKLFSDFAKAIQKVLDNFDLARMDKKKELYLANIISLIPYCYPSCGDTFRIPAKNSANRYQFVKFTVKDILTLTVDESLTPFKAYGLVSDHNHQMLVFLGTTFPGAEGFLNSLLTDFTPFVSVGKIAFLFARKKLADYFSAHKNVAVYGKSLGGSMALLAFREFESSLKEVYAVVPAGLHIWDRYKASCDKKVVIITQEGDLVSKMGYFPEHEKTHLYEVALTTKKVSGVLAHVVAFPGADCSKIKLKDPKFENRLMHRHLLTIVHCAFSFFIFGVLLTSLVLHKTRYLIQKK